MKKNYVFLVFSLLFCFGKLNAQVTIGADVEPQPFSVLELMGQYETDVFGGLRLPQLSSGQRDALGATLTTSTLAEGLMIFNTTTKCIEFWNGTAWKSLCDSGTGGGGTGPGGGTGGDSGPWGHIECGAYIAPGVYKKFMCRNLGADPNAHPFYPSADLNGDYYQWGAPMPAATWNTIITPIPWTVPAAYYGDKDNLTATDAKVKSIYDPCPPGYRVPTYAEWQGVYNTALNPRTVIGDMTSTAGPDRWSGIMFGDNLFLPAAGCRSFSIGAVLDRGANGSYWSSRMLDATYAFTADFDSGNAVMGSSYRRAYGQSLRCIAID
ncbi:MAG: fibrobacter succinogenes major paralogous domain-containing protein [Lentimicrobiaceae bacterium]|nr:fibrobacter succinogenes major paralogous domain-containing protein [Lentimicrobiaceae bacterium]